MQKVFRESRNSIYFEKRPTLNFPAHIHDNIELVFVERGGGTACCDGKKYTLRENSVFLVFPNQVHYYAECMAGDYTILIIKSDDLLAYNGVFSSGVPTCATCVLQDEGIKTLLETARRELAHDGRSPIIEAYLTAFFGKLLKKYSIEKSSVKNDTVLKVLHYCKQHYKEDISLGTVANELHLSRSTLSHIFSNKLQMNFCDYLNSLRLNEAVALMENKNYSITEISYMSGFSTIRTFNRAFFKQYGKSPSSYRKEM